ncbi:uncharacterized protein LOC126820481 [Patella vulgata]|uniref:uncharacterized protein LOC126820481 n=1 Tax=Patella vulgata TaxID=6465 RepID=UPI00217F47AC|nr:uncharacterized protein LOC126820481 [Patella vulgata]
MITIGNFKVADMDIISRLNKKNHEAAVRARRMNKSARRLLDDRIHKIEASQKQKTKSLDRNTESVATILQELSETARSRYSDGTDSPITWDEDFCLPSFRDKTTEDPKIPDQTEKIKVVKRNLEKREKTETHVINPNKDLNEKLKTVKSHSHRPKWKSEKTHEEEQRSKNDITAISHFKPTPCRYVLRKKETPCMYFPCRLPETYHSIGFQSRPVEYNTLSNYKELSHRSRIVLPLKPAPVSGNYNVAVDKTIATPRISVKDRIRGLNQYVKEMKARNERSKPKDWAIRYGEPIPRRLLLKTVVPV